jgi:integrase
MAKQDYPEPFLRGDTWYFWYRDQTGKRRLKSTGQTKPRAARLVVRDFIDSQHTRPRDLGTFAEYARPFFIDGQCPRQARLRDEGKPFGLRHMDEMRRVLKKHILPDPFAELEMKDINRGHVVSLRSRLARNPGRRSGQTAFKAAKVVLSEAAFREDIATNPGAHVGLYKFEGDARGAFALEEYRRLWANLGDLVKSERRGDDPRREAALRLIMALGLRGGELRALRWESLDLEGRRFSITAGAKGLRSTDGIGAPKWEHQRKGLSMPPVLVPYLKAYRDTMRAKSAAYVAPEALVIGSPDGGMVGAHWITDVWGSLVENALELDPAIDIRAGNRVPHSCRHTINTHALILGAQPLQVAEFLGWTSDIARAVSKVQEGYSHMGLLDTSGVAKIIGEILQPAEEARRVAQ